MISDGFCSKHGALHNCTCGDEKASQSPAPVDADVQAALDWFEKLIENYPATLPDYYPHSEAIKRALTATKHEGVTEKVIAWECKPNLGIKRFITQKQYEGFSAKIKPFYKPYKCASCNSAQLSCSTGTQDKVGMIPDLEEAIKWADGGMQAGHFKTLVDAARSYLKRQQLTKKD